MLTNVDEGAPEEHCQLAPHRRLAAGREHAWGRGGQLAWGRVQQPRLGGVPTAGRKAAGIAIQTPSSKSAKSPRIHSPTYPLRGRCCGAAPAAPAVVCPGPSLMSLLVLRRWRCVPGRGRPSGTEAGDSNGDLPMLCFISLSPLLLAVLALRR